MATIAAKLADWVVNAFSGAVGTVVTGFVASLVIAAFYRKRA